MDLHKNLAHSTLASPPSGTGGTSLTVATGHGSRFPTAPFNVTVWPAGVQPTADNAEIMRVTVKATDTFTVTRAQEGTSARTFTNNSQIAATVTARTLTDAEWGAHGFANVLDPVYGAVGDGVADDTAAIQAAVTAKVAVHFGGPQYTYRVTAAITLQTGQRLMGAGATIQQTTNNTEIFNIVAKSNVHATGLRFLGVGTDYSESDSNRSVAFYGGTSGSGHRITDCIFENFGYTTARFAAQTDILFSRNKCVGPGTAVLTAVTSGRNYGVLFDASCQRFVIADCDFSEWAQGVRIEGSSNWSLTGGSIFNIRGQHAVYVGQDCSNFEVAPGFIDTTPLCGVKVQTANAASGDNENITIRPGPMRNIGTDAVLVTNGDYPTAPTKFNRNVTIVGIAARGITQDGINLIACRGVVVSGFDLRSVSREGISLGLVEDAEIGPGLMENIGNNGIREINTLTRVRLHNIRIRTPGVDNVASDNFGVWLSAAASEYITIDDLDISSANANMEYGIISTAGVQSTFRVRRNKVRNANTTGARFVSPAAVISAYEDNDFAGTSGPVTNEPIPQTVASAATIALPPNQNFVRISGTTTITSVTANGHSNRVVTLKFADVLTFTDGSNLKLAGNFVTSADDTITIACDGTDWFEVCRSVN